MTELMNSETVSNKLVYNQSTNVKNSLNGFSKNEKGFNCLSKEDVDRLFYPTLDKLLEASTSLGHRFFVAKDYFKEKDAKWVKQFTSFPTAKRSVYKFTIIVCTQIKVSAQNWD